MDVKIGGKIEQRAVLIGIVSRSIGCARQHPGIYTKVSSYLEWINFRINKKARYRCSNEIKEQSKKKTFSRKKAKNSSKEKSSSRKKSSREKIWQEKERERSGLDFSRE